MNIQREAIDVFVDGLSPYDANGDRNNDVAVDCGNAGQTAQTAVSQTRSG